MSRRVETDIPNDYHDLPSLQAWRWMNALPRSVREMQRDCRGIRQIRSDKPDYHRHAGSSAGHHVFGREYVLDCPSGLPIFGNFQNLSPACLDSLEAAPRRRQMLSQNIVEANLQGKIADMRTGELRFAAGVANRDNKFRFEPRSTTTSPSSTIRSASSCRTTPTARRRSRRSTASC